MSFRCLIRGHEYASQGSCGWALPGGLKICHRCRYCAAEVVTNSYTPPSFPTSFDAKRNPCNEEEK